MKLLLGLHLKLAAASAIFGIGLSGCAALSDGGTAQNTPPSDLEYSANPATYTVGLAITPNIPVSARTVSKYALNATLPAGLSMDTTTGIITGTPIVITPAANYGVQANNPYGSAIVNVRIAVNDIAPTISYGGSTTLAYVVGTPITDVVPTLGGGSVVACQSIPALPAGLSLSPSCRLSGTPTLAAATPTHYFLTATNSGGSAALDLTITVTDIPPAFTYGSSTFALVRGANIPGGTPNSTGGVITSCTPDSPLPAGVNLSSNCTISGVATALSSATAYVLTASNSRREHYSQYHARRARRGSNLGLHGLAIRIHAQSGDHCDHGFERWRVYLQLYFVARVASRPDFGIELQHQRNTDGTGPDGHLHHYRDELGQYLKRRDLDCGQ